MPNSSFPHDAAYKTLFSYPEMVKSLLLDFVPEDFVKYFDFDTLEPCKSSFVGPEFQQRHDDIIWRVKWKGKDCYICLMLEFQSSPDPYMPLRILTYSALLLTELIKNKSRGKLPPVFPIVLYNGDKPWNAPLNMHDLIEPIHDNLSAYQPSQNYFLIDEKRIPKKLLDAARGEAKYVIEAEKADNGESIYQIAVNFSENTESAPDKLRRDMFQWLVRKMNKVEPDWLKNKTHTIHNGQDKIMYATDNEDVNILAKLVDAHLKKVNAHKQQYIDEGINQGKTAGIAETLLELLADRFGEIPAQWKERIDNLSDPVILKNLTKAVWKVDSPAEFQTLLINSAAK